MGNIEKNLDNYLGIKKPISSTVYKKEMKTEEGFEEVCDMQTGECKTIKTKDGLIERVHKRMITEDGRSLLMG